MTVNAVRDALKAQPFAPLTIRAVRGQVIDLPHPEFVAFSCTGRTISVALPRGGFTILDLLFVESLHFNGHGRRRQRQRGG